MNAALLEEIGLTKTEIKIYLTLLKIGQSTTTNIVREAEIHASKVYEFLDKLIQKGLVSYVIKANKKYFSAANPKYLKEFLREKQRSLAEQQAKIDKILPGLQALQQAVPPTINVEVYQDLRGVKSLYEKLLTLLKKGDTSHVIGAPRIANESIEGFLLDWHEQRIKKGVRCKYIYDSDVRDYGRVREKMKYTKVKYLPGNISSPIWIEISQDIVAIGNIKGKYTTLVAIQDAEVAKGFLDYFKLIWKISEN